MNKLIHLMALCFLSLGGYAQKKTQQVPCPPVPQFFTKEKAPPFLSGDIDSIDIKRMISNYTHCPIRGLESIKGFVLDDKIIRTIIEHETNPGLHKIESIYLYLAKRDTTIDEDDLYTLIAIPAYEINGNTHLIIEKHKNFEWHDPISNHPVLNDRYITSQTK